MTGLLSLENFTGGNVDLAKKIAQSGVVDTPFFATVPKFVPEKAAQRWQGHKWLYENMPTGSTPEGFLGGSAAADAVSYGYEDATNHYQIFKDTYGVDGSMEDAENIEGTKEFKRQGTLAKINHRMTIENSIFLPGQAPVQENKGTSTKGRMGSLDHWCGVENTLDLLGANAMNDDRLRTFLKFGALNGVPMTHIFVNDKVRDQIDDIFKSQIRKSGDDKVLVMPHYSEIKNMAYAPSLKIVLSTKVPQGEMFGVHMPQIGLVYQRLTKDKPWTDGDDAVKSQIISELTLRINSPFAVAKVAGVQV